MSDSVLLLVLAILAGGISGFAAAAIFIASQQRYLKEQALEFRKAARRLENANKLESAYLAADHGHF